MIVETFGVMILYLIKHYLNAKLVIASLFLRDKLSLPVYNLLKTLNVLKCREKVRIIQNVS